MTETSKFFCAEHHKQDGVGNGHCWHEHYTISPLWGKPKQHEFCCYCSKHRTVVMEKIMGTVEGHGPYLRTAKYEPVCK